LLEHVVDVVGLLDELHRVLRPGGRLLVSTPNHPPLRLLALALSPRAFDSHFDPRSDHVRFLSSRSLRLVLELAGFEVIEVRGAGGGAPGLRPLLLASARRPGAR
jgi:2-polyprenyl-3-methyl-5-hydroxy-6-metoxy-1,4-benzoquinol methylase